MSAPSILSAFVTGLLSFLSPCVLPLIPAYISFISGISTRDLGVESKNKETRGKVMRAALSFVLGFTLVFAVMGVAFSGGAKMLQSAGLTRILDIVGGALVMLLGVNLIFDFIGFLRVDKRAIARFSGKKISGALEALLLGMSFAVGWSPCIGPLLASILFMAGQSGSALQAFVLLLFYSGGLGIPFLLTGLFFERAKPIIHFFSRHALAVRIISGSILLVEGASMALGRLGSFPAKVAQLGYQLKKFQANHTATAFWIDLGILGLLLVLALRPLFLRFKAKSTGNAPSPGKVRLGFASAGAAVLVILVITELLGKFSLLGALAQWFSSGF
ncbi:MAG TPA: cytochrome c biogenesis protein CcdA [Spirochaetales bacterium]|nr:cytochrome c biogenesis protein CcdA [Spirochaetales bacterium]